MLQWGPTHILDMRWGFGGEGDPYIYKNTTFYFMLNILKYSTGQPSLLLLYLALHAQNKIHWNILYIYIAFNFIRTYSFVNLKFGGRVQSSFQINMTVITFDTRHQCNRKRDEAQSETQDRFFWQADSCQCCQPSQLCWTEVVCVLLYKGVTVIWNFSKPEGEKWTFLNLFFNSILKIWVPHT